MEAEFDREGRVLGCEKKGFTGEGVRVGVFWGVWGLLSA